MPRSWSTASPSSSSAGPAAPRARPSPPPSSGFSPTAGHTGRVPLGHAALFGISAYVVAYYVVVEGWSVLAAIPLGILASTVAAAIFGWLARKTTGVYFLLLTLAEGMIV